MNIPSKTRTPDFDRHFLRYYLEDNTLVGSDSKKWSFLQNVYQTLLALLSNKGVIRTINMCALKQILKQKSKPNCKPLLELYVSRVSLKIFKKISLNVSRVIRKPLTFQ